MEYFMVPAQKVPSLQHFRKTEKDVIGGLCRYVWVPQCLRHVVWIVIIKHMFGEHAHSDGAEATCSIRCVIVYMTHSRYAVVVNPF